MDIWHFLDSLYRARSNRRAPVNIQEITNMPSNFARVATTGIIWFSIPIMAGVMADRLSSGSAVFMAVALALAAAWATRSVWASGVTVISQAQWDEKSKRTRTRVGRMVESLSEQELDELRERLIDHEDEPVSLQSLMPRRMRND